MKILDVRWFTSNGCVGIVKVLDNFESERYCIGVAQGSNEQTDAVYIASWGASFPTSAGDKLFKI